MIELIVAALAGGALAGLKDTTAQVIKDAYAGLKALIKNKYPSIDTGSIEKHPLSENEQEIIQKKLNEKNAGRDEELVNKANELLKLIHSNMPEVLENIGVKVGDVNNTQGYFIAQANIYNTFTKEPTDLAAKDFEGVVGIDRLRQMLRLNVLKEPQPVKVRGTLYPSALLANGWWERQEGKTERKVKWKNDLQEWLFKGFDLWAPSWNFTWEKYEKEPKPYYIAQIGEGDEADSLPVIVPYNIAKQLAEKFFDKKSWGGCEAEIHGLLGHRTHFEKDIDVNHIGGVIEYCVRLSEDNKDHKIILLEDEDTDIYSGYLWKCLAPTDWFADNDFSTLTINSTYFIWEHTNFANMDAVKYNLDGLFNKEKYIEQQHGNLVLLQKSSDAIPGSPIWTKEQFYDVFIGKKKVII